MPAISVKMAGQRARYTVAQALQQILQDSESELSDISDHPDVDDDYIPPQGRDHLSEEDDHGSQPFFVRGGGWCWGC